LEAGDGLDQPSPFRCTTPSQFHAQSTGHDQQRPQHLPLVFFAEVTAPVRLQSSRKIKTHDGPHPLDVIQCTISQKHLRLAHEDPSWFESRVLRERALPTTPF